MRVTWATEAAPGRPNEDFVAAATGAVVVLDGCSLPLGTDLGCVHGTAWYSRSLGTRLLARLLDQPEVPPQAALAASITDVAASHGPRCDLAHPLTPAATVVGVRLRGDAVEYVVLADSVLLLGNGRGIEVVTKEHARTYAAAHPAAAQRAMTGAVPVRDLRWAMLLTDGASRLADKFGLTDWAGLVRLVEEGGPDVLIDRTREAERSDPYGDRWPRGKRHDDATVAYCLF
jgi:hypothetical protein